jgi:hypothetical protein
MMPQIKGHHMKKVIFIGGTSYSGSTFFDMILANSPKGLSCGEVSALFNPYRPHHVDPLCGCGDPSCDIWARARDAGEEYLYDYLFERFPHLEFIVDSSKSPLWIERQTKRCRARGIDVANILIWKSPEEFFASCKKRGRSRDWYRMWANYHRLYWTLVADFKTYAYARLAQEPQSLTYVCEYLGIDYFAGKENYWEREHHTLFGNTSAKIHTHSKDDERYVREQEELVSETETVRSKIGQRHRSIYYQVDDLNEEDLMLRSRRKMLLVNSIKGELFEGDVCRTDSSTTISGDPHKNITLSAFSVLLYRLKGRLSALRYGAYQFQ